MLKKYPFIKQSELKDCGVSCLSMIIKFYKGYVPIEVLRKMTNTNKNGCTAYNLVKCANEIGFNSKGVSIGLDKIENNILPCIAHTTVNNTYNHYVVIYEINHDNKYVIVGDPSDKIKKINFESFLKIYNNISIILYPIIKLPLYKKPLSFYKFTINIIKKYKKLFFKIFILSIFITITTIISSFYFMYMLDNSNNILNVFIYFFIIYILKIFMDYYRNKTLIIMNKNIDISLNLDIFKTIILLPYNYFKNRTTGEVISRINDLNIVKEMLLKISITIFIDLFLTILSAIILFNISTKLFIISCIILILYLFIILIFKKIFQKKIEIVKQKKSSIDSYMFECINGFETVKGLSIEDNIINKFNNKYIDLANENYMYEKIYNLEYLLKELIGTIGFLIVIYYGFILYNQNLISIGNLLAFNFLLSYFLEPIRNIVDLNKNIKEAESALNRINELIYYEDNKEIITTNKINNVKMKNLSYSYNDLDYSLKNINLKLNKNEKIMFIGKSGCGKSTLLKILKGYYKIEDNKLFINNKDFNKCLKTKSITYVSQNEILFTDTLYNNIKLDRNIEDKKINEVLRICSIDEIIKDNNLGLNMLIEENGFNLSGGEKQRIILSRSLLNNFEILILDESLSEVDINLERQILKKIFNKFKNKIIIMVSHRYNNIDLFDKVVHLEEGKIKEVNRKNGII